MPVTSSMRCSSKVRMSPLRKVVTVRPTEALEQALTIGPAFRRLRLSKGIKLSEAARKADMPPPQLHQIESGVLDVRASTLWRLLKAYEAEIADVWPA